MPSPRDLCLNGLALIPRQDARILGHAGSSFQLTNWIRKLPSMSQFNPTAAIAGEPGSVSNPSEKIPDWISVHTDPMKELGK